MTTGRGAAAGLSGRASWPHGVMAVTHPVVWAASFALVVVLWPRTWAGAGAGAGAGALGIAAAGVSFVTLRLIVFSVGRGFATPAGWSRREIEAHALALSIAATTLLSLIAALVPGGVSGAFAIVDGVVGGALLLGVRAASSAVAGELERRRTPVDRVVLVGRPEPLYRALGVEGILGAQGPRQRRRVTVFVEGLLEPHARIRRAPAITGFDFEQRLVRREIDRVIVVPPVSSSLIAWVQRTTAAARVPCSRVDEIGPSLAALRETLERRPESLLDPPIVRPRDPGQRSSEPLLPDAPVAVERAVTEVIARQRVLIAGAAGLVGMAATRALLDRAPRELILVDRAEDALTRAAHELDGGPATTITTCCADLRDLAAVQRLVALHHPTVIIATAGHREPRTGDRHASEVVLDTVLVARNLAAAAVRHGAARLLFVSSTCAAAPTTRLGAAFRAAELYLQAVALHDDLRCISLRLGPVLSSVEGIGRELMDAIESGNPLPLPHRERAPRFVPFPDLGRLIVEAAAVGEGSEVLVDRRLAPTRLADLAERMADRAGLDAGRRAVIRELGLCPGERLRDPLVALDESAVPSDHPSLLALRTDVAYGELAPRVEALIEAARQGEDRAVVKALTSLVRGHAPRRAQTPRTERTARPAEQEPWDSLVGDDDEIEQAGEPSARDGVSRAPRSALAMGDGED